MRKKRKCISWFCTLLLLVCGVFMTTQYVLGATGKIVGQVIDAETNQPLLGANIIIEGTVMGSASDTEGNFFIFVPPGVYNLKATMMGYDPIVLTDLRVNVGLTTTANFTLNPTVIEGKVVTVIAEEPVIKVDVASSQTILQGTDVAAIPVSNFKEVLDKQVGLQEVDARGIFMRGQRQDAISMLVDGMETRENVDDMVYTRFNPDELEQVEINAGGYSAELGNATAGVISLVTKEGGSKYFGTFDLRESIPARKHFGIPIKDYWDQYFGIEPYGNQGWSEPFEVVDWKEGLANRWELTAHTLQEDPVFGDAFYDRPELLKELYRYWMRDEVTKYGDKSDMVLSATFGGPVHFFKNTSFFTSYRREKNYYLYPGTLDHFFDQNGLIKLTTHPTTNTKLSFNFRYTETSGVNRYDYYLAEAQRGDLGATNPDFQTEKRYVYESVEQVAWSGYGAWPYTGQLGESHRFRHQYGLTFTHTLSSRTFYEVKLMANYFRIYGRQSDERDTTVTVTLSDPTDPSHTVRLRGGYALAPLDYYEPTLNNPFGWTLGGSYYYSEDNFSNDVTLRANLTSQIDKRNQINAGFEYTYYDIKKRENRDQIIRLDKWRWHVFPQHFALWANDKIEFEGLVINAGFRGDLRIPHKDWFDWKHDVWNPLWSGSLPADSNLAGPRYKPPLKLAVAPRLSISHPIGETAKLFFNWGHYYQEQPFERLYWFYRRDALDQVNYGDPELPFRKLIQYEIGYEHNLMNMYRIAVSGYYNDVKNLLHDRIGYRAIGTEGQEYPHLYTMGANRYLSNQGLEAKLEKREGRFWTGWINYSIYVYNRGVYGWSSFYEDPVQNEEQDREFDYVSENLNRPSESRINVGLNLHTPNQFGPRFIGFHPAADIDLNFLLWWRQQPTFTHNPDRVPSPYAPRNNKRWQAHWGVNMTFTKRFDFGTFITPVFYVEVYNLFNTKNMFRGAFDGKQPMLEAYVERLEETGDSPGERGDIAEEIIGNLPTSYLPFNGAPWFLYLNPRQIWLGVRFEIK